MRIRDINTTIKELRDAEESSPPPRQHGTARKPS
jgi:hypothetical protein